MLECYLTLCPHHELRMHPEDQSAGPFCSKNECMVDAIEQEVFYAGKRIQEAEFLASLHRNPFEKE